jgi:hypothetical protein
MLRLTCQRHYVPQKCPFTVRAHRPTIDFRSISVISVSTHYNYPPVNKGLLRYSCKIPAWLSYRPTFCKTFIWWWNWFLTYDNLVARNTTKPRPLVCLWPRLLEKCTDSWAYTGKCCLGHWGIGFLTY